MELLLCSSVNHIVRIIVYSLFTHLNYWINLLIEISIISMLNWLITSLHILSCFNNLLNIRGDLTYFNFLCRFSHCVSLSFFGNIWNFIWLWLICNLISLLDLLLWNYPLISYLLSFSWSYLVLCFLINELIHNLFVKLFYIYLFLLLNWNGSGYLNKSILNNSI